MWLYRVQLRTKGSKGIKPRANGRNIVGGYMLRPFAHPAAFCCVLLGVVASDRTPLQQGRNNTQNCWRNNVVSCCVPSQVA